MGEKRNAHKVSEGNPEVRRIILKQILTLILLTWRIW